VLASAAVIAAFLAAAQPAGAQTTADPAAGQPPPPAPPAAAPSSVPAPAAPGAATPAPPEVVPMRSLDQAVQVEAGATCLDPDKLIRRIERWLGRDRIDARIKVDVHGSASDPRAVSFTIDRGAERRAKRTILDAPAECDQLHSALALSIALAIDASDAEGSTGQPPPPELPSDEALLERPAPRYFRLAAALFGHASSGLLTDVAAAVTARLELGLLPWLDLRAGMFGSRVGGQTLPVVSGSFAVDLLAARLDACAAHSLGQLRLLSCAGGMAGSFRTEGQGFSGGSRTEPNRWFALVGGVELQAELASWLALAVSVDLVVPLQKRSIAAAGPTGELEGERQVPPLGVLVGAGPVFRFF